ncbi:MAG: hypothetical protein JWO69_979 [Thermoleophilia bacterium]|jgi:hypothetical protein|nr:hypothetical protein [Thermoleophilia bacterium]
MVQQRRIHLVLIAGVALVVAGCGSSDRVTYVDPNPDSAYTGLASGSSQEPIATHGVDALHRAKAVLALRGALATARTLQGTDPIGAAAAVDRSMETELPRIEGRLAARNPALVTRLRADLEGIRAEADGDPLVFGRRIQRTAGPLLDQVLAGVIVPEARQDAGFRAAVLVESLQEAALLYEQAFAGSDDAIELEASYRGAYGLLLDARTRGIDAVPAAQRAAIQARLTKVANRALPGPTIPATASDPDQVMNDVQDIADTIAAAAGIDPTWPAPAAETPGQLREVKRTVAAAAEAWQRDDARTARSQLEAAQRTLQGPAGAGIAAVDPDLVATIEHGITIDIPHAMDAGTDVSGIAAQVDAHLDDAIGLVETELEQLRESD